MSDVSPDRVKRPPAGGELVSSPCAPSGGAGPHPTHRPIWIRPSGAPLWSDPEGCWASATFEPPADRGDTEHTLRGTRLHAAVAHMIRPGKFPVPSDLEEGEWQLATRAIHHLRDHVEVEAYDWQPEEEIGRPMGTREPYHEMEGTPDLVGVARHHGFGLTGWDHRDRETEDARLILVDWKFGRYPVPVEGNRQLAAYAVMLLAGDDTFAGRLPITAQCDWAPDDLIRLIIVQPAADDLFEAVVRKATMTVGQVREEAKRLDALVDRMLDPSEPVAYNPSPRNCRWCEGARSLRCPAIPRALAEATDGAKGADGMLPVYLYEDFLARADLVAEYAGKVREHAKRLLEAGETVAGLKLVAGRTPPRKWDDERAAARDLSDGDHPPTLSLYDPPKLMSPTRLERELRGINAPATEAAIRRHTVRGEQQAVVAFEADRGETLGERRVREAIEFFSSKRLEAKQ